MNYSEEKAVNALCEVVTRHIEATSRLQSTNDGSENNETWWKLRESSILALSKTKDAVVERQQTGILQFDIIRFLDTIVLATLKDSGIQYCFIIHFSFMKKQLIFSIIILYHTDDFQEHHRYFLVVVYVSVANMLR